MGKKCNVNDVYNNKDLPSEYEDRLERTTRESLKDIFGDDINAAIGLGSRANDKKVMQYITDKKYMASKVVTSNLQVKLKDEDDGQPKYVIGLLEGEDDSKAVIKKVEYKKNGKNRELTDVQLDVVDVDELESAINGSSRGLISKINKNTIEPHVGADELIDYRFEKNMLKNEKIDRYVKQELDEIKEANNIKTDKTVVPVEVGSGRFVLAEIDEDERTLKKHKNIDGAKIGIDPRLTGGRPSWTLRNLEEAQKEEFEVFGNTKSAKKKAKKSNRTSFTQKDTIDSNNVAEIASALNENSPTRPSVEHEGKLLKLLNRVAEQKVVPETKLYLSKNASAKAVNGYYRFMKNDKIGGIYLIDKKKPVAKNEMSMLETYTHEVTHAITRYGLSLATPEFAELRRHIEQIRKTFIENNTWEVFLNGIDKEKASKQEKKRAREAWDYIQGEHGLEEFVAYGLTNEAVAKKLEETKTDKLKLDIDAGLWTQLYYKFLSIIDGIKKILTNKKNHPNDYEALVGMVFELGAANEKAFEKIERNKWSRPVNALNEIVANKLNEIVKKQKEKFGEEWIRDYQNSSKPMKVLKALGGIALLQSHENDNVKNVFYGLLNSVGFDYNGVIQQLLRNVTDSTEYERVIEKLGLLSTKIDSERENIALTISKNVKELFGEDLDSSTSEKLFYNIAKTDIQSLLAHGVTHAEIRKALIDDEYRKELNNKLVLEIRQKTSEVEFNMISNQTDGLAYYMIHNKANEVQQFNAKGIVRSANPSKIEDTKLVQAVDALAALKALKIVTKEYKLDESFVKKHKKGIDSIVDLFKAYDIEASSAKFDNSEYNKVKGYSVQRSRNNIEVAYGLESDENKYIQEGFKKAFPVGSKIGDKQIYVYINKFPTGSKYNRQAVRLTDTKSKGADLLSIVRVQHSDMDINEFINKYKYLVANKRKYKNMTDEEIQNMIFGEMSKMYKKSFDKLRKLKLQLYSKDPNAFKNTNSEELFGLAPTYDKKGKVLTYRATMSSETKEEIFELDTKIEAVIGDTFAKMFDIAQTKKHNNNVVDILIKDYKENFVSTNLIGKNNMHYVMIRPYSIDGEKGYWELMPSEMKRRFEIEAQELYDEKLKERTKGLNENSDDYKRIAVETRKEYYGVPVREDLLRYVFGERDISVINAGIVKMLSPAIRTHIAMTEKFWKDLVQVAKTNIIVKIPSVAISNIVSNAVLLVQYGLDYSRIVRYNKEALNELTLYQRNIKEITMLKHNLTAKRRVKIGDKLLTLKEMQNRINMLTENNKLSSVHDLIEKGGYLSLVEELIEDDEFSDNKLIQAFNKFRNKLPKVAQFILDYGTLDKNTIVHKSMAKSLQYSDFATKYAIYQFKTQEAIKKKEAMLKRKLTQDEIKDIRDRLFLLANDSVINYNKLDNKYLKYANDMGFVIFTKFAIGAQRVIRNLFKENPVNALITEGVQAVTYGVDDMLDSNLFGLNYTGRIHSPVDMLDSAFYTIYELPSDIRDLSRIID